MQITQFFKESYISVLVGLIVIIIILPFFQVILLKKKNSRDIANYIGASIIVMCLAIVFIVHKNKSVAVILGMFLCSIITDIYKLVFKNITNV